MAKSGIVLRQNLPEFAIVTEYYNRAKHEPTRAGDLPISRVDVFANTFKSLCDLILAKRPTDVVVVAHGTPDLGLIMPIAPATNVSTGYAMPDLVKLVNEVESAGSNKVDSDRVSGMANDWGISEASALGLARTCAKIRKEISKSLRVHIRGCDIGAKAQHLRAMQRVFNAELVSAPDCAMFYVRVQPGIVKDVDEYANRTPVHGRRSLYQDPENPKRGKLLLDIEYLGTKATSFSAVAKQAHVGAWADFLLERPGGAAGSFALAGLWPHDNTLLYWLPHETGYAGRITDVSR
ncbi:MAG TPA: hypothetical protein VFQ61_17305 [Polyangiaceae bacterium]|nr:hypothetical protein [Polyangiaceae bacterium]